MDTGPLIAEVAKGCKTTHSNIVKHSLHQTLELKDFRNILKTSRFRAEPTSSVDCPIFQPGNSNQKILKACISMHRFDTLDAMSGSLYAAYLTANCIPSVTHQNHQIIQRWSIQMKIVKMMQVPTEPRTSFYFWGPRLLEAGWKCWQSRRTERWSKASQRHLIASSRVIIWPLDLWTFWPRFESQLLPRRKMLIQWGSETSQWFDSRSTCFKSSKYTSS